MTTNPKLSKTMDKVDLHTHTHTHKSYKWVTASIQIYFFGFHINRTKKKEKEKHQIQHQQQQQETFHLIFSHSTFIAPSFSPNYWSKIWTLKKGTEKKDNFFMVWLFYGILDHPYMTKKMLMMTIPTATTTTIIEYSKWMNPRKKYSKVNFDIDGHLVDDCFCWRQYSFWLNQNRRFFFMQLMFFFFLIAVTYSLYNKTVVVNDCMDFPNLLWMNVVSLDHSVSKFLFVHWIFGHFYLLYPDTTHITIFYYGNHKMTTTTTKKFPWCYKCHFDLACCCCCCFRYWNFVSFFFFWWKF